MPFKQKKRVKKSNKYLKPGALAQIRYSRNIGKKRILLDSEKGKIDNNINSNNNNNINNINIAITGLSPIRPDFEPITNNFRPQKLPKTPKTPQTDEFESQSRLESLPFDLLVKIMCHLHHDQLRAVFHVSQRIRKAVILARQIHFNYTTPDRTRQEMLLTKTPLPTEHWPFLSKRDGKGLYIPSPNTPKAPRHGPRPPRLHLMHMKEIAAVLFPETSLMAKRSVPPGLPLPVCKAVGSNRVLFYEDELCQAVAQNKLM